MPNIIAPVLITKFNISIADLGQFNGLYYVGFTLVHIPVGLCFDRFGPKIVLPICAVLVSIGTLPLVCFDEWYYSVLGRIIVGIGSSASVIGVFKVASMYFSREKSAKMASISVIIGLLGAIYGSLPIELLLDEFGWNYVIYILSGFGFLLALSLFLVIPYNTYNFRKEKISMKDLKTVLFNKYIILISFFGGLMVGPLEGFADAWTKAFLCEVYQMAGDLASSISSVIYVGFAAGLLSFAHILEKYPNRHYEVIIVCSFAMIASFLLLFTQAGGLYIVLPALLVIGFASGYQIVTLYKALSYVNNNLIGLTTAVSNMIVMVFGYFFHTGIAKIIDLCWDRTVIQGAIYGGLPIELLLDEFGWNYVIYILSGFGFLLALSLFLVIPYNAYNFRKEKISMKDLKTVLFNKYIILISFFGGLMVGPLEGFADAWTKAFLCEVYQMAGDLASSISSVIYVGFAAGLLSFAHILEKYPNRHYEVIIVCSFAMIASFLLLFTQAGGLYIVLPALLVIGFASGYQIVTLYKALSYVNNNLIGLTTAVSNMIVMVFGYFFHTGIAKIIDLCWDRTVIQGNPVYSAELLIKATSIIPVCLLIAVFGLLWLKKQDKQS